MPSALLKPCAQPGCPELVESGRCKTHERQKEQYRGSAASRGYDYTWTKFRARFFQMLVAAGVAPVCGAALPNGPSGQHSKCKASGVLEDRNLHLDHEPPLRDEERSDPAKVCDPKRVQILCRACHSAKTLAEQRGAA